ncbi:IcmF-like protein [Escherichia coli]|nr:IcmF-like protein [Escherichia coli]
MPRRAARGTEQRLYLTPHVGKQAVIFDIDGTLCAPADADILHRRLWEHALGWLKEKRARQPLNGIILTLDLPRSADRRQTPPRASVTDAAQPLTGYTPASSLPVTGLRGTDPA